MVFSPVQAEESPKPQAAVVVTPLVSASVTSAGQPVEFPKGDGQVIVSTFSIAPGAVLPVHKHPYPRYGYVLSGTLKVTNLDTSKSEIYKTGEFTLEAVDEWHRGENAGSEPLKLLVIDLVPKGQGNTVLK